MARPVRIGVLVPSTNQVVEPDFAILVPEGVTFHTERLWNGDTTPEGGGDGTYLLNMNDDLDRGARYLASANLDIVAYCCTSGTYHAGTLEYDRKLAQQIHRVSGLPAVTAVGASLEALAHVGAHRISIAGPYGNFLLRHRLTPLLESQGLEVVSAEGETQMQQRTQDATIGDQEPGHIADFVCQVAHPDADTVFLPGTAWRALEVVAELEQRLERTVVTVNQATIWATLNRLEVYKPVKGYGRLLEGISGD
jgi:maleate isomerase